MKTLCWPADAAAIDAAASLLGAGRLVAFPTETVYGLGADGRNAVAVAALYEAKGRPRFNPLIAHVPDLGVARREGLFTPEALALAQAFWPGPLTLVVPAAASTRVCALARAGLDSLALRVPAHPVASRLVAQAGFPIVAPSANRSGRISPTTAAHVLSTLEGRINAVLVEDNGLDVGLESTIVACLEGRVVLLRPGGIPREAIEGLVRLDEPRAEAVTRAPGLLASHYAPTCAVRLDAREIDADEAVLDFGGRFAAAACLTRLDLSPAGDLREAAAHLFDFLHRLDGVGAARIAVAPVPVSGLGEAINDRLRRAAAPRS